MVNLMSNNALVYLSLFIVLFITTVSSAFITLSWILTLYLFFSAPRGYCSCVFDVYIQLLTDILILWMLSRAESRRDFDGRRREDVEAGRDATGTGGVLLWRRQDVPTGRLHQDIPRVLRQVPQSHAGLYMVVQKSGHPIYFCYNFSKWTRILTIFTVRPITRNVFRKNVNLCVPPHL